MCGRRKHVRVLQRKSDLSMNLKQLHHMEELHISNTKSHFKKSRFNTKNTAYYIINLAKSAQQHTVCRL